MAKCVLCYNADMNNQKRFIGIVILIVAALAIVGGGGYSVYRKQQNKVVAPTPTSEPQKSSNTIDNGQEAKLISERQRIVIMTSQYFEVEGKLPLSMIELHKWSGVTLTTEELEFLSKNLSWKLNGNKEVEVCIVAPLRFHSGGQCQTLVQVNADLSG